MERRTIRIRTLLFPAWLAGLLFLLAGPALAAGVENVGHVTRVKGTVFAVQGNDLRELAPGGMVGREDVLKTGPGARLEITMLDETQLTLGADTVFSVERYDLRSKDGAVLLRLSKGAFRVSMGARAGLREGPFEIVTPLGTLGLGGLRGAWRMGAMGGLGAADFWAGLVAEDELRVLLVSGSGVALKTNAGQGEITRTMEGAVLRSLGLPPPPPSLWSPDRRAAALGTVAFD